MKHNKETEIYVASVAYLMLTRRTHFLNMATLAMLLAADASANAVYAAHKILKWRLQTFVAYSVALAALNKSNVTCRHTHTNLKSVNPSRSYGTFAIIELFSFFSFHQLKKKEITKAAKLQ